MRRTEELSNSNSCINRALDSEMLFVLLSRDLAAPVAIRAWIKERIRLGLNTFDDAQIAEAKLCASIMEREQFSSKGASYDTGGKTVR